MSPFSRAHKACLVAGIVAAVSTLNAVAETVRSEQLLDTGWRTFADSDAEREIAGFEEPGFNDRSWKQVAVPHNWESYEGFRQAKHGNFHGRAWYRTTFELDAEEPDRHIFLHFEGVGSYATVWVNGRFAGEHDGGLTAFTLDVTGLVDFRGGNLLAVRADHPAGIRNLPWVCGGCELAYGFSEGTQPFGIFRPVHLVITDSLRFEPFGVHAWNDDSIIRETARLTVDTGIRNHGEHPRDFRLVTRLLDAGDHAVFTVETERSLLPGETTVLRQESGDIRDPRLWSPDDPYLYTVVSEIHDESGIVDRMETPCGIRWIEWPDPTSPTGGPLRINGQPFFVNGVADYEHLLGGSHAFSGEQIRARVSQIKAAGFNAFRDAHHPHNLRFNEHWDREGFLWWTQFGAHIWFEREDFKETYKERLRDWVRERRNSPSLFLYGLQNESKLPADFARECADLIRELDPTASTQRLITTCNGGTGTDWDIPQNWTGTYGGDLHAYAEDLQRQRLVGEYGAWRSLELHSEGGFIEDGILSEDRMTALMETKVRLAETVREKVIGHFAWPFTTHQNPGRNVGSQGQQTLDGIRELDRIGPANNKGLFSIWGEPLDVFYMYRSNYVSAETEPMVYIISHTWPDRWSEPGTRSGVIVYSNCDEVELFNDYKSGSLGTRQRGERGTHFRWDEVNVHHNILYAEGRLDGKTVATDIIRLHHLPEAPGMAEFDDESTQSAGGITGNTYLYRINAGGPGYVDQAGNHWQADRAYEEGDVWGSRSWGSRFPNLPPMFGSKREIFDPVRGTRDDPLFQSFRYGREELSYLFHVPDGDYAIELFFIEPWYGTGGGMDCTGWRLFDVAVNGQVVLENVDIWKKAGRARALREVVQATAVNGVLEISFPRVRANQAVISAIAVSSPHPVQAVPPASRSLISGMEIHPDLRNLPFNQLTWLDTGISRLSDTDDTFTFIDWNLRESDWIQTPDAGKSLQSGDLLTLELSEDANVYIVHDPRITGKPNWLQAWALTPLQVATRAVRDFQVFHQRFRNGDMVRLGPNGGSEQDPTMYSVIVKRRYPPPPSESIRNLATKGSGHRDGWQGVGNFRSGRELYRDGGPLVSTFSSRLSDCDWIRAPRADAGNREVFATFEVSDHTEVFVALDPLIENLPPWMEGWIPSDFHVTTAQPSERRYNLFRQRVGPGEQVFLGPNGTTASGEVPSMYTVILRTVRADKVYEAEDLSSYPDLRSGDLPGITGGSYLDLDHLDGNVFDWIIEVGVGDRYGLNFRYMSESERAIEARLVIIARDGQTVCEDTVQFPRTGKTAWAYSRNRTCESINAGTYIIRLESGDLSLLDFDHLVVE